MPVPPFRWRIDSLRVDGTGSADPRDYAGWPRGVPVGAELHAWVTAELDGKLAPVGMRASRGVVRWPLGQSLLLARAPEVPDLRHWARVGFLVPDGRGGVREA